MYHAPKDASFGRSFPKMDFLTCFFFNQIDQKVCQNFRWSRITTRGVSIWERGLSAGGKGQKSKQWGGC